MGNDPMPLTNMVSVLTTTLQEATSEDIVGYIVINLKPYQIRLIKPEFDDPSMPGGVVPIAVSVPPAQELEDDNHEEIEGDNEPN